MEKVGTKGENKKNLKNKTKYGMTYLQMQQNKTPQLDNTREQNHCSNKDKERQRLFLPEGCEDHSWDHNNDGRTINKVEVTKTQGLQKQNVK